MARRGLRHAARMLLRRTFVQALLIAAAIATTMQVPSAASYKFKSTWKAPGIGPLNFGGRKVAALVITTDRDLQMSAEEALKREIAARGPVAVAAYTLIPREELTDKDQAKTWFERAGVEGVVALRVLRVDKETNYRAVVWSSGYYGSFWDYYGTSWGSVYAIGTPVGGTRQDTTVAVETLLFDVGQDKLLWAGVSETTNPEDVGPYVKGLTNAVVKELEKEGLAKKAGP
jgi:hypothetical protein